jgi:chaperonin GroES
MSGQKTQEQVEAEGEAGVTKLTLKQLVSTRNIAMLLTKKELDVLGRMAVEGYNVDRGTRTAWEQKNEKAVKLALQVQEAKSFPWVDCSNVKFPLLTIAALQFLARISIMTKGRQLAKVEFIGQDPQGRKYQQGKRISDHLSLQLLEEDRNWIDSDEQAKLAASIMGSAFKKTYVDSMTGTVISEHVPVMNLVLDYYCKDINKAARITHLLSMDENTIQSKVRQGLYLDLDLDDTPGTPEVNLLKVAADESEGLQRPASSEERDILEQLCWLDLDHDGYKEPYIMCVDLSTSQVLRIVARFFDAGDVHRVNDAQIRGIEAEIAALPDDDKRMKAQSKLEKEADKLQFAADNHILSIEPVQYYTRYLFIPSPDGGVYGLGLGALLGPMNESVNTLVNQLIDSGTMSVTAGGFLGRGVKIKGGHQTFSPFEWKPVDSPGADLRNNIVPLPVREPSTVLFQLLGMLVTYSEKISGATDIMTGVNPGQNTPAETSRNTVEQGMMLFSGIYGRMYRGFKEELSKFYEFNRLFLTYSPRYYTLAKGPDAILAPDDYKSSAFRIFPAASAEAVSQSQRRDKATMLHSLSMAAPGFNTYLTTRNLLEAYDIDGIDSYYPDPSGPMAIQPKGPDPKTALEQAKLQQAMQIHQDNMSISVVELKSQLQVNLAKIDQLEANAISLRAQAQGVETGHQIALINAQIGAARDHQQGLIAALGHLTKAAATDSGAAAAKDKVLMNMKPPADHLSSDPVAAAVAGPGAAPEQSIEAQPLGAIENGNNTAGSDGMGTPPSDTGVPDGTL